MAKKLEISGGVAIHKDTGEETPFIEIKLGSEEHMFTMDEAKKYVTALIHAMKKVAEENDLDDD